MQKTHLGLSTYTPPGSDEVPYPESQPCIVVKSFGDGIVNLVAFEPDGTQTFHEHAVLKQADECCPAHYEDAPPPTEKCEVCGEDPCICPDAPPEKKKRSHHKE